ncbi:Hypothetical protein Minf_0055 [Methylacidiphilum infernorum V4]|uniref:Uncharacterized protein n=1 Tax=Methylacidiphilum infernorum (isolate V4) TaxID=481448 RepID=B3DWX5_METI4|nr:Hypothetical protein Minf_0055 [Methylacidiphilum infernorum V4]
MKDALQFFEQRWKNGPNEPLKPIDVEMGKKIEPNWFQLRCFELMARV